MAAQRLDERDDLEDLIVGEIGPGHLCAWNTEGDGAEERILTRSVAEKAAGQIRSTAAFSFAAMALGAVRMKHVRAGLYIGGRRARRKLEPQYTKKGRGL